MSIAKWTVGRSSGQVKHGGAIAVSMLATGPAWGAAARAAHIEPAFGAAGRSPRVVLRPCQKAVTIRAWLA
jgi:hypothetical protein